MQSWKCPRKRLLIWGAIALFRRVMEPKFVGDQTGLSPILSLVSVYVGMKVGGVLGMAIPLAIVALTERKRRADSSWQPRLVRIIPAVTPDTK